MALSEKMTALIAVGVSVGVNCQPCLDFHLKKAREHKATEEEIQAAINVGKVVKLGSAHKMDEHMNILLGVKNSPSSGGCACGCSQC